MDAASAWSPQPLPGWLSEPWCISSFFQVGSEAVRPSASLYHKDSTVGRFRSRVLFGSYSMRIAMNLTVDARSPIPIRRQLTEQLKHAIESGVVPRDQPLPSIRELAGFLGINTNTVARVIEDLKRSGYVEARRGRGVFVASAPPARPSPHLRARFLHETVIRAAALGMTADDLAVGVLSVAGIRPTAVQGSVEVLLVECSPPELDFFAGQLE